MSDFWSKKLGSNTPTPQRDNTPSRFTPMPNNIGTAVGPARAPQPQYEEPGHGDVQAQWEEAAGDAETRRLLLLNNPKPLQGNKDAQTCPGCGGSNLFSRRNSAQIRSGRFPMPQCYDCGWPLEQASSEAWEAQ